MICPMIKHFYHDRIGHFQDASIHHPQFNEYKNDVIKMPWPSNSPDTTSNEGLDHITSNLTFLLAEPTPACAQACRDIVLLYNLCNVFLHSFDMLQSCCCSQASLPNTKSNGGKPMEAWGIFQIGNNTKCHSRSQLCASSPIALWSLCFSIWLNCFSNQSFCTLQKK